MEVTKINEEKTRMLLGRPSTFAALSILLWSELTPRIV
jgi:hypothetical protein